MWDNRDAQLIIDGVKKLNLNPEEELVAIDSVPEESFNEEGVCIFSIHRLCGMCRIEVIKKNDL